MGCLDSRGGGTTSLRLSFFVVVFGLVITTPQQMSRAERVAYFETLLRKNPSIIKSLQPRLNKYIPHKPWPKQAAFLVLALKEGFYGGAGGGGKTDALLMAGLQFADVPDYAGLILRRTYKQLEFPDSILDRAHQWLRNTDARWEAQHNRYVFPNGSKLVFGYLQYDKDVYNYDGPAFQFIGFDETTQFTEFQYRFLFARLRRAKNSPIPLRVRSASNPGGVGHLWVKQRFIAQRHPERAFIPAYLEDNPSLDRDSYLKSLAELDEVTRLQRQYGDWDVSHEGALFKRSWFMNFEDTAPDDCEFIRFWDFAATEKGGDWTVGTKVGYQRSTGMWYVVDVRRDQLGPTEVRNLVRQTASIDGRRVRIRLEQEPGASGKSMVDDYIRMLAGYDVEGVKVTGKKVTRWKPFASQCGAGHVIVCNGDWNQAWLDELCAVPDAEHDDQADSVAGAFNCLAENPKGYYGVSFLGSKRGKQ